MAAFLPSPQVEVERFPKHSLIKEEQIGVPGGFGCVAKGVLNYETKSKSGNVVVKTLHIPMAQKRMKVIQDMSVLQHRNLVPFLGMVEGDSRDCPQLVYRYASNGNLLDYLKSKKDTPLDNETKNFYMKIILDVINGMEYLHEKDFIHGCLGARNILLDKFMSYTNAKISDYGMGRLIAGSGMNYFIFVTGQSIPIRWLPKESMPDDRNGVSITKASDVWSFGVTMWEMVTNGEVPYGSYGTLSNMDIKQHILNGSSPLTFRRPTDCDSFVISSLENIFKVDPSERPGFGMLRLLFLSLWNSGAHNSNQTHPNSEHGRGRGRGRGGRGRGDHHHRGGHSHHHHGERESTEDNSRAFSHNEEKEDNLNLHSNMKNALAAKREEFKNKRAEVKHERKQDMYPKHQGQGHQNQFKKQKPTFDPKQGPKGHHGNRGGRGGGGGFGGKFPHHPAGNNSILGQGPPPYNDACSGPPPPMWQKPPFNNPQLMHVGPQPPPHFNEGPTPFTIQINLPSSNINQPHPLPGINPFDVRAPPMGMRNPHPPQINPNPSTQPMGNNNDPPPPYPGPSDEYQQQPPSAPYGSPVKQHPQNKQNKKPQNPNQKKHNPNQNQKPLEKTESLLLDTVQALQDKVQALELKHEKNQKQQKDLTEAEKKKQKEVNERYWKNVEVMQQKRLQQEEELRKKAEEEIIKKEREEERQRDIENEKQKLAEFKKRQEEQKKKRQEQVDARRNQVMQQEQENLDPPILPNVGRQFNQVSTGPQILEHTRRELESYDQLKAQELQEEYTRKRIEEARDALLAKELQQKEQREWEERQRQAKLEAIQANERRKQSLLEEQRNSNTTLNPGSGVAAFNSSGNPYYTTGFNAAPNTSNVNTGARFGTSSTSAPNTGTGLIRPATGPFSQAQPQRPARPPPPPKKEDPSCVVM